MVPNLTVAFSVIGQNDFFDSFSRTTVCHLHDPEVKTNFLRLESYTSLIFLLTTSCVFSTVMKESTSWKEGLTRVANQIGHLNDSRKWLRTLDILQDFCKVFRSSSRIFSLGFDWHHEMMTCNHGNPKDKDEVHFLEERHSSLVTQTLTVKTERVTLVFYGTCFFTPQILVCTEVCAILSVHPSFLKFQLPISFLTAATKK